MAIPAIAALPANRLAHATREIWRGHWDTFATQIVTAGLGVISGVLAPRLLGPAGRGELAAVTLWPFTLVFLGTFGMDRAGAYFAAKGRAAGSPGIAPVATACLAVGTVESLTVVAAGLLVIPVALRGLGFHGVRLSLLFLSGAPLILLGNLLGSLLVGVRELLAYNLLRLVAPASYALAVLALYALHLPSVAAIVGFQLAGFALAMVLAVWQVHSRLHPAWKWNPVLIKQMLKFGAKTQAGGVSNYLNQRLDQLLLSLFLPSASLGIYVAAVAFADGLLIIPRGIGLVTLADTANTTSSHAWRVAKRSVLLTALFLVPCAIGLWMLGPLIIPALFGAQFAAAVLPCRILIPGSCAMAGATVLFEAARGMNHPEIPAYGEAAGLALTAILLALLLKPYGIAGAALASTIAYTFTLAVTWWLSLRRARDFQQNPGGGDGAGESQ